jgi:hypothetical protein
MNRHGFQAAQGVFPLAGSGGSGRFPLLINRGKQSVVSLPFVEIPARGEGHTQVCLEGIFRPHRFCVYADDASKLRVQLYFGAVVGLTPVNIDVPAGMFSDGPTNNQQPFVMECPRCGAPAKGQAEKCTHCASPFSWSVTDTAYGIAGLELKFPTVDPGLSIQAKFTSRADRAIGVDAAFIGESIEVGPMLRGPVVGRTIVG